MNVFYIKDNKENALKHEYIMYKWTNEFYYFGAVINSKMTLSILK